MALMLRMVGIPSRVSSGFAPGGRNPDDATFLVEDLDAHSWVEIFFPGIGWVTFDPTPAAAPAEDQLGEKLGASDTSRAATVDRSGGSDSAPSSDASGHASPHHEGSVTVPGEGGGSSRAWLPEALGAAALALALVAGAAYALRARRRSRLEPGTLAEAELAELRRALERLGWGLRRRATLLELEGRLANDLGPVPAGYAAQLRAQRYRGGAAAPPDARSRRALRRSLLAAAGWRRLAAVLVAISPGGPRVRRRRA